MSQLLAKLLFVVTTADGQKILLTYKELTEFQLPLDAVVTVIKPKAYEQDSSVTLKVVGNDLYILINDEVEVVQGIVTAPDSIQVVESSSYSSIDWQTFAELMSDKGVEASLYEDGGYELQAPLVTDNSSVLLGLLGLAALGGGSGGGTSSSSSSSSTVATSGLTVTESIDDTGTANIVTLTFNFDEDVTGFDTNDVEISGGTKGAFNAVSPSEYTLVITGDDPATPITYSVSQGAATTLSDDTITASISETVDQTGPVLANVLTSASDSTVTLIFNEPLDSSLDPAAVTALLNAVAFSFDGAVSITANSLTVTDSTIEFSFAAGTFAAGDGISIAFTSSTDVLEDNSGNDADAFTTSSGLTADGYIKGATIFFELSDGTRIDTGVVTDALGNFFLTPEAQSLIPSSGSYSIVAVGGYNVDTGLPNTQDMRAPQGSTVVNPLTTLIDKVAIANGGDVAAAQLAVKTSLNITSSVDLTSFDPISASKDTSNSTAAADALLVQKAAAAVATVIAYAEAKSGNDSASESVVDAMVATITSATPTIDLTSVTTLQALTGQATVADLDSTIDDINNASDVDAVSNSQGALLDVIAPAAPVVALTSESDTGSSNSDGLVNTQTVDIKVSFNTSASDGTAVSLGNTIAIYESADLTTAVATHVVSDVDLNRGYYIFTGVSLSSSETVWSADVVDKSLNRSALSDMFTVTQDTDAPTAGITSPISEGYINAAEDDVALTITGTAEGAEPGERVTITLSDGTNNRVKTGTVSGEAFSVQVSAYDLQQLDEGTITVTAKVVDTAGNFDESSVSYIYDATAPDAPGNLKLINDTGSVSGDNISSSLVIEQISGVEKDAVEEYRIDGSAWSKSYTAPTSQGEHVIESRQIDAAGNESEITKLTVTLDSVKPVFSSSESVTIEEEAGADSVIYTAASTDATTVKYAFDDAGSLTQDTGNGILTMDAATGAVSLSIDPDLSVKPSYTFDVFATDLAGNEQSQSVTVTVTNKNEAPFVKAAYASDDELPAFTAVKDQAAQSGNNLAQYFDDADLTETETESLTFTLATGNMATLKELGLSFDTSDGSISGTTDFTGLSEDRLAELQSGETFTVTVTDSSNDAVSSNFTFKAVSAPAIVSFTVEDATDDATTGNQGSNLTVVATLSEPFTLTLNNASPTITLDFGGASATATYKSHNGTAGTITFTATAPAGNAASTSITAISLGDATLVGNQSGQDMITDAYGSANTTYVLDNLVTAPEINLATDSGDSAEDNLTNDATVNVTLADDVVSWEYTTNGGTNWNTGTGTSFELADNTTYAAGDLGVRQTDKAGNTSEINSNDAAIVTDMTVPEFSTLAAFDLDENNSAAGNVTADADVVDYTLSGDDAAAFSISDTGLLSLKSAADFETKPSYSLTVTATDAAGNVKAQNISVTVNDLNESPTAEGTISELTAVTDQTFEVDLSNYFADEDNNGLDQLTYTLTGVLPDGLSFDTATGVISGTATGTLTSSQFTVTATDGGEDGSSAAQQTFNLQAVDAPAVQAVSVVDSTGNTSVGMQGSTLTAVVTLTEAFNYSANDTTPSLTLSLGSTTVQAALSAVDGTAKTLTFTALAPAGDSTIVSFSSLLLGDATVIGTTSGQPLVVSSLDSKTASYTLDNTAPEFSTSSTDAVTIPKDVAFDDGLVIYTAQSDDANATYELASPVAGVTLTSSGVATFTGTATGESISLTINATDAAGNVDTQTVVVPVKSAPTIDATAYDGLINLDPRSNLVFKLSESVSWGDDGTYTITLNNTANTNEKSGFQGESVDSDQTIKVTIANSQATITGATSVTFDNDAGLLIIDTLYDLDLSNNYSISIPEGMLKSSTTGLDLVASNDITFGTVTPGSLVSDSVLQVSTDDLSQAFSNTSGELDDAYIWVDGNQGNTFDPSIVTVDATDNDLAIALGFDSDFLTKDANLQVSGYTANDLLYLDNLANNDIQSFDDLKDFNTQMAKVGEAKETAKYFDTQSDDTKASQALVVLENVAYKIDATLYDTDLPDLFFIG